MKNATDKNILFVVSQIGTGGAERVISTLASYCAENGYSVHLITFRDTKNSYPISSKIIQKRIEGNPVVRAGKIRKYIKNNNIDTYVTFELNYGVVCSFGTGVKYITSMRNDPRNDVVSLRERIFRYFNFLFAHHVIFQTNEIMEYFSKAIQKHGNVIMNPLRDGIVEYHGSRKDEIVAVCRLEPQKNILMMIDVFEKIHDMYPDFKLRLFGDGSLRSEIEKSLKEKSLQDSFVLEGFQKAVDEKIQKATAYVCTSDYEGLSNSLLEAMAIGLPCVTTDSGGGGARAVIKDGENGYLVPIGDVDAMVNRIQGLIEDKNLVNKLSENASKIREKLSRDIICKEWESLFK